MPDHDPAARRADSGLDESRDFLGEALSWFVPQAVARAALSVTVTTDATRYVRGTPVACRVEFHNRLPVPIAIQTPDPRLWEWRIDGTPPVSAPPRVFPERGGELLFRGGERKIVRFEWDGRVKTDETWELAPPGQHEISVVVTTERKQPSGRTTVELVNS